MREAIISKMGFLNFVTSGISETPKLDYKQA